MSKQKTASVEVAAAKSKVEQATKAVEEEKAKVASAKQTLTEARSATEQDPSDAAVAGLKTSMEAFRLAQKASEVSKANQIEAQARLGAGKEALNIADADVKTAHEAAVNADEKVAAVEETVKATQDLLSHKRSQEDFSMKQKQKAQAEEEKSVVTLRRLEEKCKEYEEEEKVTKEEGKKAAEKAKMNESERKTKAVTIEMEDKKDKELMEKAAANNMENERKYKMAVAARKVEQLSKITEKKNKKEQTGKADEQSAKESKQKEVENKAADEKKKKADAEKAIKEKTVKWTARYAAATNNQKEWPTVCPMESARTEFAPAAVPTNQYLNDAINNLLTEAGSMGAYPPNLSPLQKAQNLDTRLKQFQKQNGLDDAPGCVGRATWQRFFTACPLPLTMAYCHEARKCVVAYQVLLYRFYTAGRITGRFCKETQIRTQIFQRASEAAKARNTNPNNGLVALAPTGTTDEQTFITLLRTNGLPPRPKPKGDQ